MGTAVRVETGGRCFFCHEKEEIRENMEGLDEEEEGAEEFEQFSLRQICHYLRVNLKQEILIFRKGESRTCPKDFSVMLCGKCSGVAERLSHLCKELELMQMWIEYSFKELVKSISTKPPSLEPGEAKNPKAHVAKLLRDRVRKLSISALQKSHHRKAVVKLEKFGIELTEDTNDDLGSYQNEVPSPSSPSPNSPESPKLQEFRQIQENQIGYTNSPSSSITNISSHQPPDNHPCPYCNLTLADSKNFRFHLVIHHPENLLSSAKLPEVSDEQFKSMCLRFIQEETKFRLSNRFYKCSICEISYKERRRTAGHMLDLHFEDMIERLKIFQSQAENLDFEVGKDPELDFLAVPPAEEDWTQQSSEQEDDKVNESVKEILEQLRKNVEKKDGGFLCKLCPPTVAFPETTLKEFTIYMRHMYRLHPEHFFQSIRSPNVSEARFKSFVDKVLKDHQFESTLGDKTIKGCTFCDGVFNEIRLLHRHQIQVHYNNICQKVTEIQKRVTATMENEQSTRILVCRICDATFNSAAALGGHFSGHHSKKAVDRQIGVPTPTLSISTIGHKCPHCGRAFSAAKNLRRHVATACVKLRYNNSQVGSSLAIKVQPEYSKDSTPKCKSCGMIFGNIFDLSRHTKLRHPQHQHLQTGKPKPKVRCPHCNLGFACKGNLNRHLKRSCPNFNYKSRLNSKISNYECEFCGMVWATTWGLQKHRPDCSMRTKNREEILVQNEGELEEGGDNTLTLHSNVESSDEALINCETKMEQVEEDEEETEFQATAAFAQVITIDSQQEGAFEMEEEAYNSFDANGEGGAGGGGGEEFMMPEEDPLQM